MGVSEDKIVDHYAGFGLYDRIIGALASNGIARKDIVSADLKYVDEFHIGGSDATKALLDPLELKTGARVLDIGSGIGGPARFMADRYRASVIGIDLTPDFVETASRLSADLGMPTQFVTGSALDLPFDDGIFDLATLLHVGMNLPDKNLLFTEAARVLKDSGVFAVYDVMRFTGHPDFPLPWASIPEGSFLATPGDYLSAADKAGFVLHHRRDRGDMATEFFAELQAKMSDDGAPVVGPPLLMGASAPEKIGNMVKAVNSGLIAPVELVFRKRST